MEHDLNILMIFGIKEKGIILSHTMYCWLFLQIYLCCSWLMVLRLICFCSPWLWGFESDVSRPASSAVSVPDQSGARCFRRADVEAHTCAGLHAAAMPSGWQSKAKHMFIRQTVRKRPRKAHARVWRIISYLSFNQKTGVMKPVKSCWGSLKDINNKLGATKQAGWQINCPIHLCLLSLPKSSIYNKSGW